MGASYDEDVSKYGYEDPDTSAASNKYGYEDPDAVGRSNTNAQYGYEDPDAFASAQYGYENPDSASKYGYENPDAPARDNRAFNPTRTPRRSSMKNSQGSSRGDGRRGRRASIGAEFEARVPGQAKPIKRRTSVGFQGSVEEIPATAQQKEDWIKKEEYEKIRKDNAKIIKHTEKGTEKKFCLRGLEGLLSRSTQDKDRRAARQAVIEEQKNQRAQGIYDADRLSSRYKMTTLQSKADAAERAETDSGDVQGYVRKERKQYQPAKGERRRRMGRRMSC